MSSEARRNQRSPVGSYANGNVPQERIIRGGTSSSGMGSPSEGTLQNAPVDPGSSAFASAAPDGVLDLDVTVLAFAQGVSDMKTRQVNSQHQMQAEMSIIRNSITSNNTELSDFKRHSAAIQQQMQGEINEIRDSLGNVFMEITAAVRNNAAADQDLKLKIQSLNEQAVRNETAFAQLADAADQSQSKLRSAVQEMQLASERMRDDLHSLNRYCENLESTLTEKTDRVSVDLDQMNQEQCIQLDRRKEHLRKMVNDVMLIGESLTHLVSDFGDQKKGTSEVQKKLQSSLYVLDQVQSRAGEDGSRKPTGQLAKAPGDGVIYAAGQQAYLPQVAGRPASVNGVQVRPMYR